MENVDLNVKLLPEVAVALEATMLREGLNASDVVNRAIAQYAAAGIIPFDKRLSVEQTDGSTVYVTRIPAA